ncbi:MAG: hypothetical protein ABFD12_04470 [Syntrophorhabdus sp.]
MAENMFDRQEQSTVKCPHCGKDARIISFGHGHIAACCNYIIYTDYTISRNAGDTPDPSLPDPVPERKKGQGV